jgi:hypothetical protein
MMLGTIVLVLFVLLLISGIAAWPSSRNQAHLYWYKISVSQEETGVMNILEHSAQGATLRLDQRELLLVMALIQEGRESFGCNTVSGQALDALFSTANAMVEQARRRSLKQFVVWQKI